MNSSLLSTSLFLAGILFTACTTEQNLGERPSDTAEGETPPAATEPSGSETNAPNAPNSSEMTCSTSCNQPPTATCADDATIRRFKAGECRSGKCEYDPEEVPCPNEKPACFKGVCYATPLCGGCSTPPADYCSTKAGTDERVSYPLKGTCEDPKTNDCYYTTIRKKCDEDCAAGVCVQGESCTLGGFCTRSDRGCKLKNDALRCLPADPLLGEGVVCDPLDRIADYRCRGGLNCVQPAFATAPLCAYICANDGDCQNVGLLGHHFCVKIQNQTYGWCR